MGHALPESLRFGVVQTAHLRGHAGGEHLVHPFNDLRAGTEIVAEQHLPSLSGLSLLRASVLVVFFQEDSRVCQPELINGLFYIAYQKAILPFSAEGVKNGILHRVGVLVFVHQDFPEPTADFPRCHGWRSTGFSQQQIQGVLLQIAEIQNSPASLGSAIILGKLLHKPHEPPSPLRRLAQIGKNLSGIVSEIAQLLFQTCLAGIPGSLDLLGQLRVSTLFREYQSAVVHIPPGHDLVPGGFFLHAFQLMKGILKIENRFFQPVAALHPPDTLAEHGNLAVQIFAQVVHQTLSPDCLSGILNFRRFQQFQAFLQPALGVQMTPGAVIDLFDDLRHQPVIPAQALGLDKRPEFRGVLAFIGPVK